MKQDLNRLRKRFLEGQFAASFMHLELGNMRKIAGRQEKARQGWDYRAARIWALLRVVFLQRSLKRGISKVY